MPGLNLTRPFCRLLNYVRDLVASRSGELTDLIEKGLRAVGIRVAVPLLRYKLVNGIDEPKETGRLVNQTVLKVAHNSRRSGGGVGLGCSKFQSAFV